MQAGRQSTALALFTRHLATRSFLGAADHEALCALHGEWQAVRAHQTVRGTWERADTVCIVAEGLVGRTVQLADGSRQIVSLHLPGEAIGLPLLVLPFGDGQLVALTGSSVFNVPVETLRTLADRHPGLARAFWRDDAANASILTQWLTNIGRKTAQSRIAHLLCEIAVRSASLDTRSPRCFAFAVSQEQVADMSGMTAVHVNRSLKALRAEGLVSFHRHVVTVSDWAGLVSIAEFDPRYLQFRAPDIASFMREGGLAG